MSNYDPYSELGVTESASFEEVRSARDRLLSDAEGDEARQQEIEAAYDAVLMDRLRARKEGRIAVPDRIRYPEKLPANPIANLRTSGGAGAPSWLSRSLYNPSTREMLVSSAVFAGLWLAVLLIPNAATTWLAISLLVCIYGINRNGRRFGMAVLFSFCALSLGLLLAFLLFQIPALQFASFPNSVSLLVTLLLMWFAATFLA
jgi:DnaJ domain.